MTSDRRRMIIVTMLVLWLGTPVRAQAPAAPPDLDAYVQRVLRGFDGPGLALAIVRNGQVVVAKGDGVRKLGEPPAVDAQTLFGIASNTKLFTATALGLLVEERKIAWDAPVVQYLPSFQMWDPFVTREITIRDLLVHRSGLGLGAGDLLWWPASTYDRKEIARLRFIRPATSFRSAYAYDNVLYLVAGEVTDAWYGDIAVELQAERLVMRFSRTASLVGDLEHWQYDTFVVRWRDRELRADAFVTFALNPDGSIDQAKMQAVSPSTDFSFDFHDLLLKPAVRRE